MKQFLLKTIKDIFSDLHLTCELCRREIFDGGYFCRDCLEELAFNKGAICGHCGRSTAVDYAYCIECKNFAAAFERARSVFIYDGGAVKLIIGFKDLGKQYLSQVFAEFMLPLFYKYFIKTDALVFIPMYEKEEKTRGYNQSQLLAESLSQKTDVPVLYGILQKVNPTLAQKTLSRKKRLINLKGAFRIKKRKIIAGKHLLIVDDVLTTGATAHTVAEKLIRAGAASVNLITVASVALKKE